LKIKSDDAPEVNSIGKITSGHTHCGPKNHHFLNNSVKNEPMTGCTVVPVAVVMSIGLVNGK